MTRYMRVVVSFCDWGGRGARTVHVWGMGSNPWVKEPPVMEPAVEDNEKTLPVDYRRWAAGAEVEASRRLGRVRADRAGLWVVGAHGGAGASTWARLLGAEDAGVAWPQPVVPGVSVHVVVLARTSVTGLEAARAAAVEWAEGACPGVELLGVLLGADAPGKRRPKQLKALIADVSGAFPVALLVPWQERWRLTRPGQAEGSLRVRRIVRTINKINHKGDHS